MNASAIVALVAILLLIGTLIYVVARPRSGSGSCDKDGEVFLFRPELPSGRGYEDFRHAFTEAALNQLKIATPEQIHQAARDGAYWHGLGFASDGALYAFDGSGTPLRYDQHDTALPSAPTERDFGLLLFAAKPAITSNGSQRIAPWNEQGQGHLPVWSQKAQLYPNHYKNRQVNFASPRSFIQMQSIPPPRSKSASSATAAAGGKQTEATGASTTEPHESRDSSDFDGGQSQQ